MRRGRKEEALRSIERLGRKSKQNSHEALAVIERTVEIEAKLGGAPTLLDLIKGTDLRRTIITCLMYASQNFAGNLIANQATSSLSVSSPPDNFKAQITDSPLRSRHVDQLFFPA